MNTLNERRKKHVDKYLIKDSMLNVINLKEQFPLSGLFVMDTESCFVNHNFEEIQHGLIDMTKPIEPKIKNEQGIKVWNKDFKNEVHCYAYGIGNTESDYVIYGTDLKNMFSTFIEIIDNQIRNLSIKSMKKLSKIKCFVHNLAWDIEFCKYTLHDMGYNYHLGHVVEGKKKNEKQECESFSIVENNNIVYQSKVTLDREYQVPTGKKYKNGKPKVECIRPEIDFIDSVKIMPKSLDQIAKKVVKIDEMFLKMGSVYDYEKWRPKGHILSQLEKEYLYNDIYILKEFLNQFYKPLNTTQTTASSISFEKFLKDTYNQETLSENYKLFENDFPDLSNKELVYDIIKSSYRGGWTQANKRYVGMTQTLVSAVSVDINSSYPAVVAYKPLPYGEPVFMRGKIDKKDYPKGHDLALLTIHFDGFKNKDEDNLIGEIQVGSENADLFARSGTEYIHSNFETGEEISNTIYNVTDLKGYKNPTEKRRYTLNIWEFELENMLENMDFYLMDKSKDTFNNCYYEGTTLEKGYEVSSTLIFKSEIGKFKPVVDNLVKDKNKGKLEGNNCLQEDAKLKMNSFYGKMGSNPDREDRELIFDEETGLFTFETCDQVYLSNRKYYPAFASAVTAWARVNLRTTLYKVGYNDVLYWDTDSLYTKVDANTIVERCGDILHKTELGKWDIEKEYSEFKAIGAKKYIVYGKEYGKDEPDHVMCKCAGLPSEVRETITFKDFYLGNTFHGKKVKTRVPGGYVLIKGSYKLNNSSF